MVSLEVFRALATAYASFSMFGALMGTAASFYLLYVSSQERIEEHSVVPLEGFYISEVERESHREVVHTVNKYGPSSTFYLLSWSIASFSLDILLIRGIKTMNALFVQIRRVYFIITSVLVLIALLLIGAAVLLFGNRIEYLIEESPNENLKYMQTHFQTVMIIYGSVLVAVLVLYSLVYWILTGLVRTIREHEQGERTNAEGFQPSLATGNCGDVAGMKNQNNEFDV